MNAAFETYKLSDEAMSRAKELADAFDLFLYQISRFVPAGRELAIITTKLEEACFFAKKGMARFEASRATATSEC